MKPKAFGLVPVSLLLAMAAYGETFKANRVEALDGIIKCNWARDRLVTVISGPCEDYTPPSHVRVGATFQANGKSKTINVIFADQVEKDMPSVGLRAGEWICTAAESSKDIPHTSEKSDHTGTWLYIPKCKPLE
jgi:hypothetical protein